MKNNSFVQPTGLLRTAFVLCTLSLSTLLTAQTTVTGLVMDGTNNEIAIGASIIVPGTTVGTVTDFDGRFTIEVPDGKFILQISMVGYKTQVVNIKGKTSVEVKLMEDAQLMDEVVVVGYGVMKKRDLSGSVSQLKGEDIMAGSTMNTAQSLEGKIAGVDVKSSDGAPGSGVSITVRGANSFTTSSQPLYIVDGVPFGTDPNGVPASGANDGQNTSQNPLSMINPNDIEKIEVLKDASATAIYGSRGANGVVIITTRKGQEGRPRVELNIKGSIQQIGRKVEMLDPYHYALYQNEAAANSRTYEGGTQRDPYRGEWDYPYIGSGYVYTQGKYNPSPEDFLNPGLRTDKYGNVDEVAGADWQQQIYQLGWSQEYNAAVSGGTDKGYYSFSGSYAGQTGIIKNTGYKRYGLSINTAWHITKWLEIGTSQHFTNATTNFQRTNSENTGIIRSSLIFPPTYGPHAQTEQLDELNWLAANPLNYVNGAKDELKQISWFSSSFLEFTIQPWLKLRQNLGLGYNDGHRSTYYDRHTQEGKSPYNGKAGRASNIWKSLTTETLLTFDHKFNEKHSINAVLGVTFERGWGENESMTATNFPNDLTKDANMALALDKAVLQSSKTVQSLESYLARVNYTLMGRYLFTVSARVDGSSSFARNHKWAPFFSGAFAWRMIEESWMQDQQVLSNWKWRVSFGETGNQAIGAYRTLTVFDAANYPYAGTLDPGAAMIDWRGPTNPDLKWETTDQADAGLDIGFANNRVNITLDYYWKKTRDLLQNVTIPSSSGFSQMMINSGWVINQGFELSLSAVAIDIRDWKWTLDANFSLNRNRIGGLKGDQYATALWSKADQVFLQRNGCPIGTLYGYKEEGIDPATGEIVYADLNGDGVVTEADRTIIGNTNPDFTYSLTSRLSWKGLSLNFMLQGSHGNDIFNYNLTDITMSNIGNITKTAYEGRWTPETATTATWPKPTAGYTRTWLVSDRYVEDGSFLKIKYITLSYDWNNPAKWLQKINFNFTVNNVWTFTRYSWFEPDVNAAGTNPACPGVDSYSYPSARTYSLGINFVF
ncbi:MAG: TonB-dependent receptor [Paludibacteraceae bacterium]|nr:TonB-dependent receptor [Paludibacteraceae bacterium]